MTDSLINHLEDAVDSLSKAQQCAAADEHAGTRMMIESTKERVEQLLSRTRNIHATDDNS